jgi:ABC-2 type transport system ATP-binding protein
VSAAIEVHDLILRYGDVEAVSNVSFTADAGRVTAVLGPNGAGKTSTIETLEGYRSPTGGSVTVLGLDPVADHAELVRGIGVMLQAGGVYRAIRVAEAAHLFAAYYDDPLDADRLIERVGLGHRRSAPWRALSGGEQQRLSLALALVGRPEVVFLDEPTAGLDVSGRRLVHELIGELRSDGVTILLATHDLFEAESLADRVVIIDGGRLVGQGSPSELAEVAGPPELRFAADPGLDTAALAEHLGADVRVETPGEYVVSRPGDPRTVARLTAWLADHEVALGDLRAGRQRLEDTFLRLTTETSSAVEAHLSAIDGHSAEVSAEAGRRPRRRRDGGRR